MSIYSICMAIEVISKCKIHTIRFHPVEILEIQYKL